MGREEAAAAHLRFAFEKCKILAERHPRYGKYLRTLENACTGERQAEITNHKNSRQIR